VPTILRVGPYRFFFYASDRKEPAHGHVERDIKVAKFRLKPVQLAKDSGFSSTEIRRIEKLVKSNSEYLLREWNEYFKD